MSTLNNHPLYIQQPSTYTNMENQKLLKTCRICGLQAFNEQDLELFVKRKKAKHGRRSICKSCYNAMFRKGGSRWSQQRVDRIIKWHKEHPERIKEIQKKSHLKRITLKEKRITLDKNPRTNVCSSCGKKYPEDLKEQTIMHHEEYNLEKPLENTIELCRSCHGRLHRKKEIKDGTFWNFQPR